MKILEVMRIERRIKGLMPSRRGRQEIILKQYTYLRKWKSV